MTENLSCIILTIELVLYLTTVTSVSYFELAPIAKEVDSALEKMDLPQNTKDAFAKHYINVGGYSSSFIELLDSYKTLSYTPIRFDDKEKSILTLSSSEDPLEYKVCTQLKYYRKMQEVQCTDYFMLYYHLYEVNWDIQHIIRHVYNMIKMAYLGKFVIFAWLLKLHINLLTPSDWKHEEWVLHLTREGLHDIEQYKTPLGELVNMCMKHKYLEEKSCAKESLKRISEHDNFNIQLHHTHFNNNESPLPFSVDYLYLEKIRREQQQIEPITSTTIGWEAINDLFQIEISKINEQLSTEEWKMDPFKNIRFQQMFLEIVRVKLYGFVWFQLCVYQKMEVYKYKYCIDYLLRLDFFMSLISDIVEFINIEDKTLNILLTLYNCHKNGKPNYEQIEILLEFIKTAINNSLSSYFGSEPISVVNLTVDDVKNEPTFNLFLSM